METEAGLVAAVRLGVIQCLVGMPEDTIDASRALMLTKPTLTVTLPTWQRCRAKNSAIGGAIDAPAEFPEMRQVNKNYLLESCLSSSCPAESPFIVVSMARHSKDSNQVLRVMQQSGGGKPCQGAVPVL